MGVRLTPLALIVGIVLAGCGGDEEPAEVGEPTTLERQRPEPTGAKPILIGAGESPKGARYEFVAYEAEEGTCVALQFPGKGPDGGSSCYRGSPGREYVGFGLSLPRPGRWPEIVVSGDASPDVERVHVLSRLGGVSEGIEADLVALDGELLRHVGGVHPIKHYVAFLDAEFTSRDLQLGRAQVAVMAYNDAGEEVDSERTRDPFRSRAVVEADRIRRFRERVQEHCRGINVERQREDLPDECREFLDRTLSRRPYRP